MADATPTRRSVRKRKVNTRYAGADWDREALRRIRAASTSSGSSPSDSDLDPDVPEDIDFDAIKPLDLADAPSDDGSLSSVSERSESIVSEDSEDDGGRHGSSRVSDRRPKSRTARVPASAKTAVSRSLRDIHHLTGARRVVLPLMHGPSEEDLTPIYHSQSTWLRGRDSTLPSRLTLSKPESSFMHLVEEAEKNVEAAALAQAQAVFGQAKPKAQQIRAASYFNKSRQLDSAQLLQLSALQTLTKTNGQAAAAKEFVPHHGKHTVVTGPIHKQRAQAVHPYETRPLSLSEGQTEREGWLLNVGEKVQALAWAPKPGDVQYLAVAVRCTPSQRETAGSSVPRSFGPAFTPSTSYPSSVQIWAFYTKSSSHKGLFDLDTATTPRLVQVLGMFAGDIRDIKWAPTSDRINDPAVPLLLGVLSTDSHLRIAAINLHDQGSDTHYSELMKPVIDIPPPTNPTTGLVITGEDPVSSTFDWLSPHELIIGTSNGLTFSYDILEVLRPPITNSTDLITPYQTLFPHQTYITALTPLLPLLPATHRLIASSCASGDLNLTSLYPSHPSSSVHTHRSRLPSRLLTYSPYTRSVLTIYPPSQIRPSSTSLGELTSSDAATATESTSSPTLSAHHLRRFNNTAQLARLPLEGGAATALAEMSVHHPCVLMGNAAGEVWATNYLRRVLSYKSRSKGKGGWLLKVVRADWREDGADGEVASSRVSEGQAGSLNENGGNADVQEGGGKNASVQADLFHGPPTRKGMTRLVFGWRAVPVELGTLAAKQEKQKARKKIKATGTGYSASGKKLGRPRINQQQPQEAVEDKLDADGDIDMADQDTDPKDMQDPSASTQPPTANPPGSDPKQDPPETEPIYQPEAFHATTETIFEEEQAVTALAWSKNRQTAGWAAVGWGSGLVMVRDLAV